MTRQNTDFGDTDAARMLRGAIAHTRETKKISQRDLAKALGYKQSAVLSHMALGRVPIPVERAAQLAEHLSIDPQAFLVAILKQRFPSVKWNSEFWESESAPTSKHFVRTLEAIAGRAMDDLSSAQMRVMREVAADPNSERRWLSVHEVQAINLLRRLLPKISSDGLSPEDENLIEGLIGD